MKTFRFPLHVIDAQTIGALLDMVTDIDGVVAALVQESSATLEVVVSRDASALLVREQVWSAAHAAVPA